MAKTRFSFSGWFADYILWRVMGFVALIIAAVVTVDASANSDGFEIE